MTKLRRGPTPQTPDDWLLRSARRGDVGGIRAALADGATLLDAALVVATRRGRTLAAEYLLDHGADANWGDGRALAHATLRRHFATMRMLIARGTQRSLDGALMFAAANRNLAGARFLLDAGASPAAEFDAEQHFWGPGPRIESPWMEEKNPGWLEYDGVGGRTDYFTYPRTASLQAAWSGSVSMMELLVDRGVVVAPAHAMYAVRQGHSDLLRWLVARLPDSVSLGDWVFEALPFHWDMPTQRVESTRTLIELGFRPSARTLEHQVSPNQRELLALVVRHVEGPLAWQVDHFRQVFSKDNMSALSELLAMAPERPGAAIAAALLLRGEERGRGQFSPAQRIEARRASALALGGESAEFALSMLELEIRGGAFKPTQPRVTQLGRYMKAIRVAARLGASLDAPLEYHGPPMTALARAATLDDIDAARLLLTLGADIHADDEAALRMALREGNEEFVRLFLNAGADSSRPSVAETIASIDDVERREAVTRILAEGSR